MACSPPQASLRTVCFDVAMPVIMGSAWAGASPGQLDRAIGVLLCGVALQPLRHRSGVALGVALEREGDAAHGFVTLTHVVPQVLAPTTEDAGTLGGLLPRQVQAAGALGLLESAGEHPYAHPRRPRTPPAERPSCRNDSVGSLVARGGSGARRRARGALGLPRVGQGVPCWSEAAHVPTAHQRRSEASWVMGSWKALGMPGVRGSRRERG